MDHFSKLLTDLLLAAVEKAATAEISIEGLRASYRGPTKGVLSRMMKELGTRVGAIVHEPNGDVTLPISIVGGGTIETTFYFINAKRDWNRVIGFRGHRRAQVALLPYDASEQASFAGASIALGQGRVTADAELMDRFEEENPVAYPVAIAGIRGLAWPSASVGAPSDSQASSELTPMGWLVSCLEQLGRELSTSDAHNQQWLILERVALLSLVPNAGPVELAARLGLPSPGVAIAPVSESLDTLERLGDFLDESNLRPGFIELKKSESELEDALDGAYRHLVDTAIDAQRFKRCPMAYWSPTMQGNATPVWWSTLTIEALRNLLGQTASPERAKVKVSNAVQFANVKGLPIIVDDLPIFAVDWPENVAPVAGQFTWKSGRIQSDLLVLDPLGCQGAALPIHEAAVKHAFTWADHPGVTVQIISLATYAPGVIPISGVNSTIRLFKARRSGNRPYEGTCGLKTSGRQTLMLRFAVNRFRMIESSESPIASLVEEERPLEQSLPVHCRVIGRFPDRIQIEIDVQAAQRGTTLLKFRGVVVGEGGVEQENEYHLSLLPQRDPPRACPDRFMACVEQVRTGAGPEVDVREAWIHRYCQNILRNRLTSHLPIILGPGYDKKALPENRDGLVVLTDLAVSRPALDHQDYCPSDRLLALRATIFEAVSTALQRQSVTHIEELDLNEALGQNCDLPRYLEMYADEIASSPRTGSSFMAWFDAIAVYGGDGTGNRLAGSPSAVLLHPLHPLRLGWQVTAQRALVSAIGRSVRTHLAGCMSACSVPDSFTIAYRKPTDRIDIVPLISIPCSSSYWQVLWSESARGEVVSPMESSIHSAVRIFDADLGVQLDGLIPGLDAGQVQRALDDLVSVLPAASRLRIELNSRGLGSDELADGVLGWARENLGPSDLWHPVAHRSLEVLDRRQGARVDSTILADASRESEHSLTWRSMPENDDRENPIELTHLGLVSHIGCDEPFLDQGTSRAALGPGVLLRSRVRATRPLAGQASCMTEPRVSSQRPAGDGDGLEAALAQAVYSAEAQLERDCGGKTHLAYSPDTTLLQDSVRRNAFTAIASTETDPAEFARLGNGWLWDYDLPLMGSINGDPSGYYLVASQERSHALDVATDCLARMARDAGTPALNRPSVASLLTEVSRRGVPTLKEISLGSTSASGALATLAVLRFFQPVFVGQSSSGGIFPIISSNGHVRLAIPIDPFSEQIDRLRAEHDLQGSRRPDLLLVSIHLDGERPTFIHLTPVEVKYRTGTLSDGEAAAALRQAEDMTILLKSIVAKLTPCGQAQATDLEELISMEVLTGWLDFGFRTYSRCCDALRPEVWSAIHQSVIQALLHRALRVQVSDRGRLAIIHNCQASRSIPRNADSIPTRIDFTLQDGMRLLGDECDLIVDGAKSFLGTWGLDGDNPNQPSGIGEQPAPINPLGSSAPPPTGESGVSIPTTVTAAIQSEVTVPTPTSAAPSCPVVNRTTSNGIKFDVGTTTGEIRPQSVSFWPSNTALNQLNVGIVGDMGTGKTQLVQYLIAKMSMEKVSNRDRAVKFLIFDYKRDYSKPEFVDRIGARVVVPRSLPLNVLAPPPGRTADGDWILGRALFLFDTLERVRSGLGPKQRQRLKDAVRAAFAARSANGNAPTLRDVLTHYTELSPEHDSVSALLDDLVGFEIFTEDAEQVVPFSEFQSGLVVLNLSHFGTQDHLKSLVVAFMLSLFYESMLLSDKHPFIGVEPQLRSVGSMILIDEADNIMSGNFDILKRVLTEGREFGVGVILASQYLSHFRKPQYDYAEPLGTWFVHKVPRVSIADLRSIGLSAPTQDMVRAVQQLPKHNCLVKTLGAEGRFMEGIPFYRWSQQSA